MMSQYGIRKTVKLEKWRRKLFCPDIPKIPELPLNMIRSGKHAFDQESDQEKKERKHALGQESDQ